MFWFVDNLFQCRLGGVEVGRHDRTSSRSECAQGRRKALPSPSASGDFSTPRRAGSLKLRYATLVRQEFGLGHRAQLRRAMGRAVEAKARHSSEARGGGRDRPRARLGPTAAKRVFGSGGGVEPRSTPRCSKVDDMTQTRPRPPTVTPNRPQHGPRLAPGGPRIHSASTPTSTKTTGCGGSMGFYGPMGCGDPMACGDPIAVGGVAVGGNPMGC